jgi:hypothetical protein
MAFLTMNTTCSPGTFVSSVSSKIRHRFRAWVSAARSPWVRWITPRGPKLSPEELKVLDGLTAETLSDIGAPEWVYERAHRAQERAKQGGLFEQEPLHWR